MILTFILLFYLHLHAPAPAPAILIDGLEWDSSAGSAIIAD